MEMGPCGPYHTWPRLFGVAPGGHAKKSWVRMSSRYAHNTFGLKWVSALATTR